MKRELWQDMIDVNLTGVWLSTKAAIPHLIAGGRGGSIVLTSSVAGLKAYPNVGHYVAAKHGVVGIMRTLAQELGQYGIRVNSVHPTQVNTPMVMNDATFRLFRPDLENRPPKTSRPSPRWPTCCPCRGWSQWTSATPYCSWPRTKPAISLA
jgi:(+)-trans-carveol dehydrogenase